MATLTTPDGLPLAAEILLRQIADNIAEMLWTVDLSTGQITYTNPAFKEFWGLGAAALQGAPWKWLETLLHRVQGPDQSAVRSLHRGSTQQSLEFGVRGGEGRVCRLRQRVLPLHGRSGEVLRVVHLANDITWQQETTSRLRAEISRRTDSEAQYRAVVEHITEGVLITDSQRILHTNPQALKLMGLTEDSARACVFADCIQPADRERVQNYLQRTARGLPVPDDCHFQLAHSGAEPRWIEVRAVPFQWQGKMATLHCLTDATRERLAERQLQEVLVGARHGLAPAATGSAGTPGSGASAVHASAQQAAPGATAARPLPD